MKSSPANFREELMMGMTKRFTAAFAGLLMVCTACGAQQASSSSHDCDAPSYFGICDPYVPGTFIGRRPDMKAINVLNTWPDGPAEKSGVCPGDQIIAMNGIPVAGHTWNEMLRQLASPSPSPIDLKVTRGKQELDFHFDRARESTLAQLSHEKFMLRRMLMAGLQTMVVPADETPEEAQDLARFYDGVDRRVGFKFIDGMDVPEGTPEEQVKKLRATRFEGPEHERWAGSTRMALGENSYSAGFDAWLLKNPEEVLVNLVLPGSPAHRAGLFPGDQILEVSGHPVSGLNAGQLSDLILKPDQPWEIILKLQRGQSTVSTRIETQKITEIDDATPYQGLGGYPDQLKANTSILSFVVLYVENPREAMVDQIDYPSPAFDAGLHVGDRVLAVNAVPVEQITSQQLEEMLQPKGNSDLKLDVMRLGKKLSFQIKPVTYAAAQAKIGSKITEKRPVPEHCPAS
jgi:C-terminal processing protease CtpA/Prc